MAWVREGDQLNAYLPVMEKQTKVELFMRTVRAIRDQSSGDAGRKRLRVLVLMHACSLLARSRTRM
jgi:hypothetical protein